MSADFSIRRARAEDADALTALCILSKQSHGYDDAFMEMCREELRVTPERIAAGNFYVAETVEICGCACLRIDGRDNRAEVEAFFVHPDFQGKGVGRVLWETLLRRAKELDLRELFLDADPFAVGFYKKLGFAVVCETPSGSIPDRTIPHMTRLV